MNIDLGSLKSERSYEEMIAELLSRELPHSNVVRANPGDGGIDVFSGSLSGAFDAYQVKYFTGDVGDSQKAQIRKSLVTVARRNPKTWTLVTATTFDEPTQRWFEKHVGRYSFPCDHWDAKRVHGLLNTHFGIRRAYFGDPAADALRTIAMVIGGTEALHEAAQPELLHHMVEANELLDIDNPDFGWERSFDRNGVLTMTPYPKHPAAVGTIEVKVKIPTGDPEAARVTAGWNDLLTKGRPLEVPGRFVDELVTKFGIEEKASGCDLRIEPQIGTPAFPTRFEFKGADGQTAILPYVSLRCVELGSEQFRLSNEEQGAPGVFSLIIKSDLSSEVTFNFQITSVGRRARDVLPYERFLDVLPAGGELTIRILEPDALLGRLSVPAGLTYRDRPGWVAFLEDVSRIENDFGVELPLPEQISEDDTRSVARLISIIEQGGYELSVDKGRLVGTPETAESLLAVKPKLAEGSQTLFIGGSDEEQVLFGVSIPLDDTQVMVLDVMILDDDTYLKEAAAAAPNSTAEFLVGSESGRVLVRYKGWPRSGESELFKGLPPFE